MIIPYNQSKELIKEADILLFRAGRFPTIGWWISKYTHSYYSHAALAHWNGDELDAVEFREFVGGRIYPLEEYIKDGKRIDVFRCVDTAIYPCIEIIDNTYWLSYKEKRFDADVATKITNTAIDLVDKIGKYSYWTIWQMFKSYIPFVRLGRKIAKNGEPDTKQFVCSTLVTYVYRKHFIDPVPFLCDSMTAPGDLARSGLFSYLFSINS